MYPPLPLRAESTCCNGGTPKAPKPPKEKKVKPQKPKKGELLDKDSKEPKGVAAAKELTKATKPAPFQVRHIFNNHITQQIFVSYLFVFNLDFWLTSASQLLFVCNFITHSAYMICGLYSKLCPKRKGIWCASDRCRCER